MDESRSLQYRAASVTKTFTAAGVMLLVQEGKIKLHDKITEHIDIDIPFAEQITIEMLLRHTAGVFDITNTNQPCSRETYVQEVLDDDPLHTFTFDELMGVIRERCEFAARPSRDAWNYSNTNYIILAKLIEVVSGKKYDSYIDENFIKPLKLKNTYLAMKPDDSFRGPFLPGYLTTGEELSQQNVTFGIGSSNLVSTAQDLSTWISALLTGKTKLSSRTVERMKQTIPAGEGMEAYGLGLAYDSVLGWGHGGIIEGYMGLAYYSRCKPIVAVNNCMDPANIAGMREDLLAESQRLVRCKAS